MPKAYVGYLSEIRMMSCNVTPPGWAVCDGPLLQIAENQGLYQLLGTTFGGDGKTTFALPDLRGRAPIGAGESNPYGTQGGEAEHQLTADEVPGQHNHIMSGSTKNAQWVDGIGRTLAQASNFYIMRGAFDPTLVTMAQTEVQTTAEQPHENRQPYLAVDFIINTVGDPPPTQ